MWPFVKNLITKHFNFTTTPIVIDGWHLRPEYVAEFDDDSVDSNWLYISPEALEQRERNNFGWIEGSTDPEKMFENFMGRSLRHNRLIKDEAERLGRTVVHQEGNASVEDLCELVLERKRT